METTEDSTKKDSFQDRFKNNKIGKKHSVFIDKLIFFISLWASIFIYFYNYETLKVFELPYKLDTPLIILILLFLIYVTLNFLKWLAYISIIAGAIYLLVVGVTNFTNNSNSGNKEILSKNESSINNNNTNKFYLGLSDYFDIKYTDSSSMKRMDSLFVEIDSLKKAINTLNLTLDSIKSETTRIIK